MQGRWPRKLKRVIIREEYVALTGDYKKAVILHELEYRQSKTYDLDAYLEEEGARLAERGITANVVPSKGWFRRPAEQLSKDTLLNLSPSNTLTHVRNLVERGWLQERANPNELRDRTKQYRLDLVRLKADLEHIGYQLEGWSLESLGREGEGAADIPFSVSETAFPVSENGILESENPFSKTKKPISKTEEHYIKPNTHVSSHPPTRAAANGVGGSAGAAAAQAAKSRFSREEIERYFAEIAKTDRHIQSVPALARARWVDGSEDGKILAFYEALERKKQTAQERAPTGRSAEEPCPVCRGLKVEVVSGKGARPCRHCRDAAGSPAGPSAGGL